MVDLPEQIDTLRRRLMAGTGLAEANRIADELERLHREKVFSRPSPPDPARWRPIPVVSYERPAPATAGGELDRMVKAFFETVAAGLSINHLGFGTPEQFVALFRLVREGPVVRFVLVCPYEGPVRSVSGLRSMDLSGLAIAHRYTVVEDVYLPIAFWHDRAASRLVIANRNQLDDPTRFIVPRWCRTTSGLLNFVSCMGIAAAKPAISFGDTAALMNDGLDEWFRWLYCLEDTGELLDPDRLYVERAHPERFVYDYAGPPRPVPGATVGTPRRRWAVWERLGLRRSRR
jgi:hypothetical protein